MKLHLLDAKSGATKDIQLSQDAVFSDLQKAVSENFQISTFVLVFGGTYLNHQGSTTLEQMGIVSGDKLHIYPGAVEESRATHASLALPPEPRPTRECSSAELPPDAPTLPLLPEQAHREPPPPTGVHPDTEFYRLGDDPNDPLATRHGHRAPNFPAPNPLNPFGHGPLGPLGQPGGPLGPASHGFDPFDPRSSEIMPGRPQYDPTQPRILPFNPTDEGPSRTDRTGSFGRRHGGNDYI
ncbi:unnamed protein product, partial [Mesorhabditis belari]|uniref:Ubiquitin-like domain-containing protein n=1 Tax=Mesorhabditis belari TaxID=2138241 RepID=A0AAF3J9X1_9BILA